ncbi:MAG: hypothetical protein HOV77_34150 [Hamadaea sp.]|uniref:hypothetical protein n=1 Tax=Hamadaea sp. TaxID=2024425 RepID=UPI0018472310|nr:hypothetical protein [Hamadaea sp.]NUT24224.1 hypothetical protein [Hamadaea sp.]
MDASDWITLGAVIATPVTAALSIIFTHRGSLRLQRDRHNHERQQRLTGRRMTLYIDMAEYARDLEARLPYMADEMGVESTPGPPEGLVNEFRLDARVQVIAPPGLVDAWTAFRTADKRVQWEGLEHPDGIDPYGQPYLKWDGPALTQLRSTLSALQASLRETVQSEERGEAPSV